jgi:molybdopterin synthase sulfur carrier subunit
MTYDGSVACSEALRLIGGGQDTMSIKVRIPTPLRKHTGQKAEVIAEGATIKEVFEHLDRLFPGFRKSLYEEDGTIKRFINVYLDDEDIRYIGGETAPVTSGNVISIVPAIAGGRRP